MQLSNLRRTWLCAPLIVSCLAVLALPGLARPRSDGKAPAKTQKKPATPARTQKKPAPHALPGKTRPKPPAHPSVPGVRRGLVTQAGPLRRGASRNAAVVQRLDRGTRVLVLGAAQNGFYSVRVRSGRSGWFRAAGIRIVPGRAPGANGDSVLF